MAERILHIYCGDLQGSNFFHCCS